MNRIGTQKSVTQEFRVEWAMNTVRFLACFKSVSRCAQFSSADLARLYAAGRGFRSAVLGAVRGLCLKDASEIVKRQLSVLEALYDRLALVGREGVLFEGSEAFEDEALEERDVALERDALWWAWRFSVLCDLVLGELAVLDGYKTFYSERRAMNGFFGVLKSETRRLLDVVNGVSEVKVWAV